IHVIGGAVIAMFIGMTINHFIGKNEILASGIKFTSKKILKFAIILLGLSLNITTILEVGKMSLVVMVFTLATCFGGGYFIGKALGLNWKLSNLISAGTGICGGSAIAAIAPTIDADDSDVAYAMSATFLFPWHGSAWRNTIPAYTNTQKRTNIKTPKNRPISVWCWR
ncbi:MAG: putative sulfate exporter family transporter, partial [Clostridia bacterium]|nr:putative sulfate exporter family transporter [Clostridia bacterium]